MSVSRKRRAEAGVSMISLIVLVAVAALSLLFMQLGGLQITTTTGKIRNARFSVAIESAMDTMLLAYRFAEISYNMQMGSCTSGDGQPFLEALKTGHGCTAGVGAISVFGPNDIVGQDITPLFAYTNAGGCTIDAAVGLQCAGKAPPVQLITIGQGSIPQQIDGATFAFSLNRIVSSKSIAEMAMEVTPTAGVTSRRAFAIRASLVNAAHIEGDGRVTQENPDPNSLCPGKPWATFMLYDKPTQKCQMFAQIGGGNGLGFYHGRFFGFRPGDGKVVDLMASSTSPSYLVDPATGTTCPTCPPVFPPYNPDSLRDSDDISVVEDQIYFVSGSGPSAYIGVESYDGSAQPIPAVNPAPAPGTSTRVPICPLGKMGWGQAYVGISGTEWSDPILPAGSTAGHRAIATFFLKTDTGNLHTATVLSDKGPVPAGFAPNSCLKFTSGGDTYWSCCLVFVDGNLQAPEYHRTYGFERAGDSKPYYLY